MFTALPSKKFLKGVFHFHALCQHRLLDRGVSRYEFFHCISAIWLWSNSRGNWWWWWWWLGETQTLKLDLGSNSSSVRCKPWGPDKVSKIYLNFGFHAYKMETTTDTPQKTVVRTSGRQHTSHTGWALGCSVNASIFQTLQDSQHNVILSN